MVGVVKVKFVEVVDEEVELSSRGYRAAAEK
jgi:hypothetical protein